MNGLINFVVKICLEWMGKILWVGIWHWTNIEKFKRVKWTVATTTIYENTRKEWTAQFPPMFYKIILTNSNIQIAIHGKKTTCGTTGDIITSNWEISVSRMKMVGCEFASAEFIHNSSAHWHIHQKQLEFIDVAMQFGAEEIQQRGRFSRANIFLLLLILKFNIYKKSL